MQTRKFSRTLNEAFGPYCSNTFEQPHDWQDKVVLWGCALAVAAVVCLALFGWIV